jgi:hypothetical protein
VDGRSETRRPAFGAGRGHAAAREQLRLLFRFSLVGYLATLLVSSSSARSSGRPRAPALFAWFVAVSLVAIGRYLIYKAFMQATRRPRRGHVGAPLHRRHRARGLCWAAIGTLLLPDARACPAPLGRDAGDALS